VKLCMLCRTALRVRKSVYCPECLGDLVWVLNVLRRRKELVNGGQSMRSG
jgi:hypothetical protein